MSAIEHQSPLTTPLAAVEAAVQERAKSLSLDLDNAAATRELRDLIDSEVIRWREDHRRGIHRYDITDPDGVAERAFRNIVAYGPLGPLLDDDDVWEVMINAPDSIFVKRHVGQSGYHSEVFHDDAHVTRTLTKILDDASGAHRTLDPSAGMQDAQLDNGARLHIVHGDLSRGSHTMVNIRKFTGVPFRDLSELVERGSLGEEAAAFLRACIGATQTIVFAGAPGAGKTTLLSCCAAELDPTLRVVVAEEVFEADVPLANVASMQTHAARPDRDGIDLRRLVAGFLRMAPDIAIVGEVRDREALPLLLTLSSGVKGFTTIHSGSARQALTRLRFVSQLSDSDLPMNTLNNLVTEAIDVVVHCERTPAGPQVSEIIAVEELAGEASGAAFTTTPVFARRSPADSLDWSGMVPTRLSQAVARTGIDLAEVLAAGRPATVGPVR